LESQNNLFLSLAKTEGNKKPPLGYSPAQPKSLNFTNENLKIS
jgi:hypothetical protein